MLKIVQRPGGIYLLCNIILTNIITFDNNIIINIFILK